MSMDVHINMIAVKIILFGLLSTAFSATVPTVTTDASTLCDFNINEDCTTRTTECQEVCGCDRVFKFDEKKGGCVVNLEYLRELTSATHYISEDKDYTLDDRIATRLQKRVDRVFGGILISAILFMVCASACAVSVCLFCCHVRYSDRKLKNEVNALAAKLKIDIKTKDSAPLMRKSSRDQKEESCNVVVTDANIMCV